ncbi:M28 family metallopeptidase [Acanthopleuribacter pedis]|uniref:Zn-dependent exopeptidase M28 n=1 Tax=Acanthopleuribacter pedis TaxID=442870 RepID=A0A8J7QFS6_9BACT|nr:Zn-dependent exopeptidase M28 [Acanthopleuribacter pedis]MBO1317665.1 Zn-dependent exopeptidase M28 [Acanthopleuribacter pedis]
MSATILAVSLQAATPWRYAVFPIDAVGPAQLEQLKHNLGTALWVEADDQLFAVLPADHAMTRAEGVRILDLQPEDPHHLYMVQLNHTRHLPAFSGRELLRAGRIAVVHAEGGKPNFDHKHGDHDHRLEVLPLRKNTVIAFQAENRPRVRAKTANKDVRDLVARINPERWLGDIQTLAAWSRGSFDSDIIPARDWLISQFEALNNVSVSTQQFTLNGAQLDNVIATITGSERPDEWYIIGAHYDSTNGFSGGDRSPGAEDNASGTAGLLELARIFSEADPKTSLVFIAYSGEEQGLHGSRAHVNQLIADGNQTKVRGMLNMDMIGYTGDEDLDVLLETASFSADLIDTFTTAAETYTDMRVVSTLNPFGSDHVPYLNAGLRALLVIENDWNEYPHYHRQTDEATHISMDMGGNILRMNTAVLAEWAGLSTTDNGEFSVAKTMLLPWLSKSDRFESTLVVNNTADKSTRVRLTARRADGSSAVAERDLGASGFIAETTTSLFPDFPSGGGFTVTVEAGSTAVESRWVTNNIADTASGASPSQGVAVTLPQNGLTAGQEIGDRLLFGYLPVAGGSISAPVIVNVGDRPIDVTLTVYNAAGTLLATDIQTGANLSPLQPLAVLTSDLVSGLAEDVQVIAHSPGNSLCGVVFVFNSLGEPAIGTATVPAAAETP